MNKMKSFVRTSKDNMEVKLSEMPIPNVQANQVLIKVAAFGVGIHDRYFIPTQVSFPFTIGSEGAGVITEIGIEVSNFKIGDRVIFTTILQPEGGSWAEYAVCNENNLIHLPDNLSFAQGAALPIASKTALECMRSIQLEKDNTLFIAGASGAIGTFVIQLATKKGIRVSASASQKNQDYMQTLGAEKTVDYHDSNWIKEIQEWSGGGVDAALAIQPRTGINSIKAVKDGGKVITVSGDNQHVVRERNIVVEQMGHNQDTHQQVLEFIKSLANDELKLVIEKEYAFEDALDALQKTETRHARGKVVVTL